MDKTDQNAAQDFLIRHFQSAQKALEDQFLIEIRTIKAKVVGNPKFFPFEGIHSSLASVAELNRRGSDIYFGVNPRPLSRRKRENDIGQLICFWADIDVGRGKPHKTRRQALDAISGLPVRPHHVFDSGNGYHCYWYLENPISMGEADRSRAKQILFGLIRSLDADRSGSSLERVMRLPGTINHKCGRICRPVNDCELRDAAQLYRMEDFEPFKAASAPSVGAGTESVEFRGIDVSGSFKVLDREGALLAVEGLTVSSRIKDLIRSGQVDGYKSRSERDWAIISSMVEAKYDDQTIESVFLSPHLGCSDRIRSKGPGFLRTELTRAREKLGEISQEEGAGLITQSLDTVAPQQVSWIWPTRIPLGKLSLLVGNPDEGKSFLSLFITARVSRGEPWPDSGERSPRGSVLILTAEDGIADTVVPRLIAVGGDGRKVHVVKGVRHHAGSRSFNLVDDLEGLKRKFEVLGDVVLVVIDPITAYLKGGDANHASRVREILSPIKDLAEESNVGFLGISHLNKNSAMQALYRTTGSTSFVAASRSVWLVALDPSDESQTRRFFIPLKANLAPARPSSLAFRIHQGKVEFEPDPILVDPNKLLREEGGTGRVYSIDQAEEFLRRSLQGGAVPSTELDRQALEQGISLATLRRAADRLGIQVEKRGRAWFKKLPN